MLNDRGKNKNLVGRPRKKNPVIAGQLSNNLCRFSFIADRKQVDHIKKITKKHGISIKNYMNMILDNEPDIDVIKLKITMQRMKSKIPST